MTSFDIVAGIWLSWVIPASLQFALLALIVAGASRLMRKSPAKFRHAIWLLLVLKVFLPPTLVFPGSSGWLGLGNLFRGADSLYGVFADPVAAARRGLVLDPEFGFLIVTPAAVPTSGVEQVLWYTLDMLFVGWLGGIALFGTTLISRQVRLQRQLRRGRIVGAGVLHGELVKLAAGLGLKGVPRLILSADTSVPFLCGFWNPTIILPATLPGSIDAGQLRAVLLHELIHWRRGDLGASWLVAVAQVLFWFHPCVWMAARVVDVERELAVDEASVEAGCDALAYCRALVEVAAAALEDARAVSLSFLGGGRREFTLEARVRHLLAWSEVLPRSQPGAWAGIALFATVFLPMGPADP